ncbi:hypothetical protein SERLADRAFT_351441 [Serpula lacrymans var. lacrymans S7.9]|uniref:FAD-binding domain-containing protein n=1 Tax=Serpula lacrymans var. lacrymans (strain S7.9) TaxID=578457 RepID=F8P7I7_SERL9|nr:uncharacterized protein SERLADRAFT_351441 [Serpula lacrymans var. lacrymans S7.9]EGO21398.1 hypothetical protein SERLADRAFT_351441 [Serpula lacrymans var. lacrymans S7.9]
MSHYKDESQVDVLIIGAGPAGSFLAFALGRAGISTRIVDKREVRIPAGHADGIQPRIIEVFQSYGIANRFLELAELVYADAFYNSSPNGGIRRTKLESTSLDSRFPFEATLSQAQIEGLLRSVMDEHGVHVEQPKIPISLTVSDDETELQSTDSHPVRVVLKRLIPDKEDHLSATSQASKDDTIEVVKAKYVVGADGAHSWVRKTLGIDMIGESTNYVWGAVDFVPETDFPDIRLTCAIHAQEGSCMLVPRENDMVRIYVQLEESKMDKAGRLDRSQFGAEDIIKIAQKLFYPYKITMPQKPDWWTAYIIGQRVASQFSVSNRAFIIGDACHTHSPKAGQGMNASMNDAHNLAWKLIYTLRQWAPSSLLNTYEFERHKFAQDLIDFDKVFATLYSTKPQPGDHTYSKFVQTFVVDFGNWASGCGIQYEASAIVDVKTSRQSLANKIIVGQRVPPGEILRTGDFRPYNVHDVLLSDTRFKIIIFSGDVNNPKQKAKLDAIAARLDQPEGFLQRYTPYGAPEDAVFDIVTIRQVMLHSYANVFAIPSRLRSHWSKYVALAYFDGVSNCGRFGGNFYSGHGISDDGAIVVCRPDGYVGIVVALDELTAVEDYFAKFLSSSSQPLHS